MVYRRRNSFMRPINSIKHIVDQQGGTVPATKETIVLVNAVDNAVSTTNNQVTASARVSSIYLNVQVQTSAGTSLNNAYMAVYKNPGNQIQAASIPDANQIGTSNIRKQFFHQEMAMTSDSADSIPITLFRGVLKVPQRYQRMGLADTINLQLFFPGNTFDWCVQCIYKEYK